MKTGSRNTAIRIGPLKLKNVFPWVTMCDLVILVCDCTYLYGQHKPTVAAAGTEAATFTIVAESPKSNDFCRRVAGILLKLK